eukprot:617911-Amphidinium_carterae.1
MGGGNNDSYIVGVTVPLEVWGSLGCSYAMPGGGSAAPPAPAPRHQSTSRSELPDHKDAAIQENLHGQLSSFRKPLRKGTRKFTVWGWECNFAIPLTGSQLGISSMLAYGLIFSSERGIAIRLSGILQNPKSSG